MKEQAPPPFKLHFEDGTSGNFIKTATSLPQQHILEKYSRMKYGRRDRFKRTFEMLEVIAETDDESILPMVIYAAESVLVDYYTKKEKALNFYDVDNEEEVVYIFAAEGPEYNYVARITRMILAKLYDIDFTIEQLFAGAYIDYPSLIENLKFERDQCAKEENYQDAIFFRDFVRKLEKKSNDKSHSQPS